MYRYISEKWRVCHYPKKLEVLSLFKAIDGANILIFSFIAFVAVLVFWFNKNKPLINPTSNFLEYFEKIKNAVKADGLLMLPFLAWISALSGRSGSLRFAWGRTRGNYAAFLLIAIMTNLSIIAVRGLILFLGGDDYVTLLFLAPLTIYFNVVSAKAYEFFFLEIE